LHIACTPFFDLADSKKEDWPARYLLSSGSHFLGLLRCLAARLPRIDPLLNLFATPRHPTTAELNGTGELTDEYQAIHARTGEACHLLDNRPTQQMSCYRTLLIAHDCSPLVHIKRLPMLSCQSMAVDIHCE
jgi:hypothetical protein